MTTTQRQERIFVLSDITPYLLPRLSGGGGGDRHPTQYFVPAERRYWTWVLARVFAYHLAQIRPGASAVANPTSISRPEVEPGEIRIPHLVTAAGTLAAVLSGQHIASSHVMDIVIWEVMHQDQLFDWLGSALPDQTFAESNLLDLLILKGASRSGQLPQTTAGDVLREILARGRYLAIRLVYRHDDLFRNLVREINSLRLAKNDS